MTAARQADTEPELADPWTVRAGDLIEDADCRGRVTEAPVRDRGRWVVPFCCRTHAVRHALTVESWQYVRVLARMPRELQEV